MGWRAWDAYEREANERWKALPRRERYSLQNLWPLALFFAFVACFAYATFARGASLQPGDIHVIDGDTIRLFHKKSDVRLVDFNAPRQAAMCAAEAELGANALQNATSGRSDMETDRLRSAPALLRDLCFFSLEKGTHCYDLA